MPLVISHHPQYVVAEEEERSPRAGMGQVFAKERELEKLEVGSL